MLEWYYVGFIYRDFIFRGYVYFFFSLLQVIYSIFFRGGFIYGGCFCVVKGYLECSGLGIVKVFIEIFNSYLYLQFFFLQEVCKGESVGKKYFFKLCFGYFQVCVIFFYV